MRIKINILKTATISYKLIKNNKTNISTLQKHINNVNNNTLIEKKYKDNTTKTNRKNEQ